MLKIYLCQFVSGIRDYGQQLVNEECLHVYDIQDMNSFNDAQ